jgi:SAM-dependent methyltransferase
MSTTDLNYVAYNEKAQVYIDKNPGGTTGGLTPAQRVERFKQFLSSGRVLEIGSGAGWDADALHEAGFEVIASDYVPSFLKHIEGKSYRAITFDGKKDEIPSDITPLDGVYVNAVFVHFNADDFTAALQKIYNALRKGGVMYFSVMHGRGTEIAGRAKGIEREFFYYNQDELKSVLEIIGFAVVLIEYPIDEKWIHVICHKK